MTDPDALDTAGAVLVLVVHRTTDGPLDARLVTDLVVDEDPLSPEEVADVLEGVAMRVRVLVEEDRARS